MFKFKGEVFFNTPYKGYLASRSGKIYSMLTNQIMDGKPDKDGYIEVCFMVNGKKKFLKAHRVIAETFLKKENGKDQVNHKNKKRTDNRVSNLEWVSISENANHREHGDTEPKE